MPVYRRPRPYKIPYLAVRYSGFSDPHVIFHLGGGEAILVRRESNSVVLISEFVPAENYPHLDSGLRFFGGHAMRGVLRLDADDLSTLRGGGRVLWPEMAQWMGQLGGDRSWKKYDPRYPTGRTAGSRPGSGPQL